MKTVSSLILQMVILTSCHAQKNNKQEIKKYPIEVNQNTEVAEFYLKHKGDDEPSISVGTVSSGKLLNGKLFPFYGPNYTYFDAQSYLAGRGFIHSVIRDIVLESYKQLEVSEPERHFYIMECSNEHGGQIYPHRTHQNGTSVDFMMPKLKNDEPYTDLDHLGGDHYWLSFDNQGKYSKDPSIVIDFNLIAKHILILNEKAKKEGYKIAKVIIKIEFKDELFETEYGKKLKESGIYIVRNLNALINSLHDEHYHIDFEPINK
jgi:penicillin-insensitive murein endopeptidase